MKKYATTAAAAAIMLAGLTGASTCSDAASVSASEHSQQVRRVVSHSIEFHHTSENHSVGVDRLRGFASHKIVGYDNFASKSNPRTGHVRFWLTLSLDGGTIDTSFNTPGNVESFTGRITHGSGKFRGIEGTMHVRITDRVVYTLRYSL